MVFDELVNIKGDFYRYFGSLDAQLAVERIENARRSVQKRLQRGIQSRSIRTLESDLDDAIYRAGEEYLREVRYFPKIIPPHSPDLYIYDQKLAILVASGERFALIIESPELSTLMGLLWDMIWDISLSLEDVQKLRSPRPRTAHRPN
jgi:hypothetical protein